MPRPNPIFSGSFRRKMQRKTHTRPTESVAKSRVPQTRRQLSLGDEPPISSSENGENSSIGVDHLKLPNVSRFVGFDLTRGSPVRPSHTAVDITVIANQTGTGPG